MPTSARLVGRDAVVAAIDREYRRAAAGEFRSVLLLADPGLGKTRVGREVLARLRRRSITLAARAYPLAETASFGVWSEALERHLRDLAPAEVAELCGGFLDDMAAIVRSIAAVRGVVNHREPPRLRLLEGLAALIANLAHRRPVVIFLDDAHVADASSWECLGYLARNIADARVLVVAAARPAELTQNGTAEDVVLGLEQEGLLARLTLTPLDREDLARLAEDVIDDLPPRALLDWLLDRSQGNPLFAVGLLQALVDEGADFAAPGLRSLPEELAERVATRVRGLSDAARETLETLATLGRRVKFGELVGFAGLPMDRLSLTLEQLVRSRLVVEAEQGPELEYEIAHPLIEEAIYQRIGGARRRGFHRRVGRTLYANGQLGEAALHLARTAQVGDHEAIQVLSQAVRDAEARGSYRESLTILDALVVLLPAGDERWLNIVDALAWRAEWVVDHRADGHARLGIKSMRAIDSLLVGSANSVQKAEIEFRLANFLGWGSGDLDDAERACTSAHALFEQAMDPSSALLAENELAWMHGLRGDYVGMEAAAASVAQAADGASERFASLQAWHAAGFAAFVRGRFAQAEAALERSNAIARHDGKVYRLTVGLTINACNLAAQGRLEEALPRIEAAKVGDPGWRDSILPEWETIVHWFAGDFTTALACAHEASARAVGELSRRRAIGVIFAALSAIEAAQPARARADLNRIRRTFGDRDWQFFSHLRGHVEGLLAWQAGARFDAVGLLRETATRVVRTGADPFAALVLVDLTDIASESGSRQVAAEAAGQLAEIARRIDHELYYALAAIGYGYCKDVEAARLGVEMLAGSGWRAMYGRALDAYGRSACNSDPDEAVEALERAVATFAACGSIWRRDRSREALRSLGRRGRRAASAILGASTLSRRERQVARLAAEGLTAREIAERLMIGERTVETHLASVYAKLGLRSKTDLVRRAAELAINP